MTWGAHIAALAADHGVTLDVRARTDGRAFQRSRTVRIETLTTAKRYAVALHEIGHLQTPRTIRHRLEKELYAWAWAESAGRAAGLWDRDCVAAMRDSLRSYRDWAERRRGGIRREYLAALKAILCAAVDQ